MAFGNKTPVSATVAGQSRAHTVVTDNRSKETIQEIERTSSFPPVTFDKPHIIVTVGHDTSLTANYQSVKTSVHISIPCDPANVGVVVAQGWDLVEKILEERALWAKEVLTVYSEVRNKMEER